MRKQRSLRIIWLALVLAPVLLCTHLSRAAEPGKDSPLFSFVQVTDTHLTAGKSAERVRKAIDDINLLEPQPEFTVVTGDLINGPKPRESTELYRELFSQLRCPLFSAYGNHDDRDAFRDMLGEFNYAFDLAPYHFIVLDSIDKPAKETYGCRFSERTVSWLRKHLQDVDKDRPVIVFSHGAVYRPDSYSGELPGDVLNYKPVLQLLEPYNVVAWFAGHGHANSRVRRDGVSYFATGCISNERGNKNAGQGYRIVRVWEDRVETEFRTLDQFRQVIRVGQDGDADVRGDTDAAIRRALEEASAGDVVSIGPGTYTIRGGLKLKSGVTIDGMPDSVLRLPSPTFAGPAQEGSRSLFVVSSSQFKTGDEVEIRPPAGREHFPGGDRKKLMVQVESKQNASLRTADPLPCDIPPESRIGYSHNMFHSRGERAEDITIRNLTLDGGRIEAIPRLHGHMNRTAVAVAGKYSYGGGPVERKAVRNLRIENCHFRNFYGRAVALYYVLDGTVRGCVIENIDDEGIDFDHFTRGCRAVGNVIRNARTGVTINDGSLCTVAYNRIENCDPGITMWWWHKCPQKDINIRNRIHDNVVLSGGGNTAISLGRRCRWNTIAGNVVEGNIDVEEPGRNVVEGNRQR